MKDKKSIFILGAGIMQIPAINTAKKNGWFCIVADRDNEAPGIKYADQFEKVDLKDYEKIYSTACKIQKNKGLDGIFTAGTDFSASVAYTAEKLSLPGISYETALVASNKALMRKIFKNRGIPSPKFTTVKSPTDNVIELSYPVVVKPVDNMGARGVKMVRNKKELPETIAHAIASSRSGEAIIEEFIPGKEYSLDALINNGQITITGIADRHIQFSPYFVEMGHTIPTAATPEVIHSITDIFAQGIKALGINHGAAKGDIFYGTRGAIVGEIAARLSGGYMSGWTYPYASGINLTEAAMKLALGIQPGNLSSKKNWFSAERAFISIPGIVEEITGIKQAKDINGVKDIFLRVKNGQQVSFPINNVQKCGNIISSLPERIPAIESAEKAASSIVIKLSRENRKTEQFLFSDDFTNLRAYQPSTETGKRFMCKMEEKSKKKSALPVGTIAVFPPMGIDIHKEKDWNHRSIENTISLYTEMTKTRIIFSNDADMTRSALFWRCLFRGGIQGLLYLS